MSGGEITEQQLKLLMLCIPLNGRRSFCKPISVCCYKSSNIIQISNFSNTIKHKIYFRLTFHFNLLINVIGCFFASSQLEFHL